jgi:hypothetical protein
MSDLAHETLERHEHLEHNPEDGNARRAALVIGLLAAVLAVCDMGERSSQNAYLAHHIGASNEYAFYQARQTRALVLSQSAVVLSALPATPESQKAAADALAESKRLTEDSPRGNGSRQIQARADAEAQAREVSLHRYEWYELVTSALQIAIVLSSVSVVTRIARLTWLGAGIGLLAGALAALVATGIV